MSTYGDDDQDYDRNGDDGNDSPDDNHAAEESKLTTYRKKRRPSLNNPKIKPRQADDDTSTLNLLAQQNEERRKKQEEFGDPANEMLAPKNNYILILLQQHLLSAGYERTAKLLKEEAAKKIGHKIDKFVLPKTKSLRKAFVESLKSGNEHAFFEARRNLHEELNYYQLDFELSLELEMKTRVYFALYYLIYLDTLKIDADEAKKKTKDRIELLKAFFVEKGSHFADDTDLKEYLKVPYLVENMPLGNQVLSFVLSKDFVAQIIEQNEAEIDRVIFFSTEATRHRSFVTKMFEYYIKYNPNASNSALIEGIYQQVEAAIELVLEHGQKYQTEAEELQELYEKLNSLLDTTRSRFQEYLDEEKSKSKNIAEAKIEGVKVVQVNREWRAANEKFTKRFEEIKRLTTEFEEVTAFIKKVQEGKNPDELPPDDFKIQKEFMQKKQQLLILKLNLISIEMKKPSVDA